MEINKFVKENSENDFSESYQFNILKDDTLKYSSDDSSDYEDYQPTNQYYEIYELKTLVRDQLNQLDVPNNINIKTLLRLNQIYQDLMKRALKECDDLLKEYRNQLEILDKEIDLSMSFIKSNRIMVTKCGIPYFKTPDGYHCEPNEDIILKSKRKEMNRCLLPKLKIWGPKDYEELKEAVDEETRIAKIKQLQDKQNGLRVQMLKEKSKSTKKEIEKKIKRIENEIQKIKKLNQEQIFYPYNYKNPPIDWYSVSVKVRRFNHNECEAAWQLYLHPEINKKEINLKEFKVLRELVQKNHEQNWDQIAEQFPYPTRSSYQLALFYYLHKYSQWKQNPLYGQNGLDPNWNEEDDKFLMELVDKCKRSDGTILWTKVQHYMKKFTTSQCFQRYNYVLNPTLLKGKFTKKEDDKILELVKIYGLNFPLIAKKMGNRTSVQIRNRYHNNLKLKDKVQHPWTVKEDEQILEHVKSFGEKHWKRLSDTIDTKNFRNSHILRHRYLVLKKWLLKSNQTDLKFAPRHSKVHNVRTKLNKKSINGCVQVLDLKHCVVSFDETSLCNGNPSNLDRIKFYRHLSKCFLTFGDLDLTPSLDDIRQFNEQCKQLDSGNLLKLGEDLGNDEDELNQNIHLAQNNENETSEGLKNDQSLELTKNCLKNEKNLAEDQSNAKQTKGLKNSDGLIKTNKECENVLKKENSERNSNKKNYYFEEPTDNDILNLILLTVLLNIKWKFDLDLTKFSPNVKVLIYKTITYLDEMATNTHRNTLFINFVENKFPNSGLSVTQTAFNWPKKFFMQKSFIKLINNACKMIEFFCWKSCELDQISLNSTSEQINVVKLENFERLKSTLCKHMFEGKHPSSDALNINEPKVLLRKRIFALCVLYNQNIFGTLEKTSARKKLKKFVRKNKELTCDEIFRGKGTYRKKIFTKTLEIAFNSSSSSSSAKNISSEQSSTSNNNLFSINSNDIKNSNDCSNSNKKVRKRRKTLSELVEDQVNILKQVEDQLKNLGLEKSLLENEQKHDAIEGKKRRLNKRKKIKQKKTPRINSKNGKRKVRKRQNSGGDMVIPISNKKQKKVLDCASEDLGSPKKKIKKNS